MFGEELIIDLTAVPITHMTKAHVTKYLDLICGVLDVEQVDRHWWRSAGEEPHLNGYSVIQFIKTSSITIHTVEPKYTVHINIFTCNKIPIEATIRETTRHFRGKLQNKLWISRGASMSDKEPRSEKELRDIFEKFKDGCPFLKNVTAIFYPKRVSYCSAGESQCSYANCAPVYWCKGLEGFSGL